MLFRRQKLKEKNDDVIDSDFEKKDDANDFNCEKKNKNDCEKRNNNAKNDNDAENDSDVKIFHEKNSNDY